MNRLIILQILYNLCASHVSIKHKIKGYSTTISTACSSSTQAIGEAFRLIKFGQQDYILAGEYLIC